MPALQPTEVFALIPGFDRYRVSDSGQLQSLQRDGWQDMKPFRNPKDGYLYAGLWLDGRRCNAKVHRLVLLAFVGPCPDGHQACHGDGNRTNNRLSNLRWDTIKNNHADKALHGTNGEGPRNPSAKLTDAQVMEMRRLASQGRLHQDLALRFGVSRAQVTCVVNQSAWRHLPAAPGYQKRQRLQPYRPTCFQVAGPATCPTPDVERFLPIPGFPWHRISNFGRIQSCLRQGSHLAPDPGRWHDLKTDRRSGHDYPVIRIQDGSHKRKRLVHRLVLEAFIGPCPAGCVACHFDGDRRNCRLDNLRWDTPSANAADRIRHGTAGSRLTPDDVRAIRSLLDEGHSTADLGRRFGVHPSMIGKINRGQCWSHVT